MTVLREAAQTVRIQVDDLRFRAGRLRRRGDDLGARRGGHDPSAPDGLAHEGTPSWLGRLRDTADDLRLRWVALPGPGRLGVASGGLVSMAVASVAVFLALGASGLLSPAADTVIRAASPPSPQASPPTTLPPPPAAAEEAQPAPDPVPPPDEVPAPPPAAQPVEQQAGQAANLPVSSNEPEPGDPTRRSRPSSGPGSSPGVAPPGATPAPTPPPTTVKPPTSPPSTSATTVTTKPPRTSTTSRSYSCDKLNVGQCINRDDAGAGGG